MRIQDCLKHSGSHGADFCAPCQFTRRCRYCQPIIPATIAAANTSASQCPKPSNTKAGPGQIPAKPQPMPNSALPQIKRRSMPCAAGAYQRPDSNGRERLAAH